MNRYEQIKDSLKDKEHREAFMDKHIDASLALQIREMRNSRGWTQAELAKRLGVSRVTVAALESHGPKQGQYTMKLMKKVAKIFDVALLVRYAPFSEFIAWVMALERIAPPEFNQEFSPEENK